MSIQRMSLGEIHKKTSHLRNKITPHAMDFGLYPLPCKDYGRGVTLSLEEVREDPGQHLSQDGLLPFLSDLLYLCYGVTHTRQAGAIPFLFRTVPSAGGLYPCHLYLAVISRSNEAPDDQNIKIQNTETARRDIPETGLFYYDPPGHRLILLGRSGENPPDFSVTKRSDTALVFMVTAGLYNSAWKYRDRAIRYVMLDGGHLAENLVLAGGGKGMSVAYDFDDLEIGRLLGLDLSREVPLALATLGWDKSVSEAVRQLGTLTPCSPDVRIRPGEMRYMAELPFPAAVHALGRPVCRENGGSRTGDVRQTPPAGAFDLPGADRLPELMVQRRSRRNFIRQVVHRDAQQTLLSWLAPSGHQDSRHPWIRLAVACRNWEGRADGLYTLDGETAELAFVRAGNFNGPLARICLGQEWVGMAGAVFLCLADLKALEEAGGIRAYRYAMLEAGRAGQRIYLGAEAAGQGCCGIGAIYDDEAASLLELDSDTVLVYALAVGPVKKKIYQKDTPGQA